MKSILSSYSPLPTNILSVKAYDIVIKNYTKNNKILLLSGL